MKTQNNINGDLKPESTNSIYALMTCSFAGLLAAAVIFVMANTTPPKHEILSKVFAQKLVDNNLSEFLSQSYSLETIRNNNITIYSWFEDTGAHVWDKGCFQDIPLPNRPEIVTGILVKDSYVYVVDINSFNSEYSKETVTRFFDCYIDILKWKKKSLIQSSKNKNTYKVN